MRWSDEEVLILKTWSQWETVKQMAERLGRSEGSVKNKLYEEGIFLRQKRPFIAPERSWSKEDIDYLKKNAKDISTPYIAKRLGKSIKAVRTKASRLGLSLQKRNRAWSEEQVDTLFRMVEENQPWSEIAKAIGKRADVCRKRAYDFMLKAEHKRRWTQEEDSTLKSLREDQELSFPEIALQLDRSIQATRKRYYRIIGKI